MTVLVNAGFRREVRLGRKKKVEWRNVQEIKVDLPDAQFGEPEFRDAIRRSTPAGEGWRLEGYCRSADGVREPHQVTA